ncbi:hypothetical protein Trydic_g17959 [Trypoxylus dichotomus]
MQPQLAQATQSSINDANIKQLYAIKSCVKLGETPSETLQMIRTVYGDALSSAQVFRWHKIFKDSRETIDDGHHESVVLARNRPLTLKIFTHKASISKDTIHPIVTKELGIRKIYAKLMHLSNEQRENHFFVSQ